MATTPNNRGSKVRLELFAAKLKNVAGAFKGTSDPYAVVTLLANDPNEQPKVLGKTEVIKNSLHPKWTTCFELDYELGRMTRVNVGVYDEVRKGAHKPMGSAMFEIGEVLGARGNTKAKQLRNGGTLYCRVTPMEETQQQAGTLHVKIHGHKLKNVDGLFGKSDPFFEINARVDAAGGLSWQPAYRSKHIDNNLNPHWPACQIDMGRLCGGDRDRPIEFKVWDWQKNGKHQIIGSFETSVSKLIEARVDNPSDASKGFAVKKRGKLLGGHLIVVEARVEGGVTPGMGAAAVTGLSNGGMTATAIQPMPVPPPSAASSAPAFGQALGPSAAAAAAAGAAAMASSAPNPRPVAASNSLSYMNITPSAPLPPPMAPPAAVMASASVPPPLQQQKPRFVDYLTGGCELELMIAIDFTGSNGDPRKPGTLHYIHPTQLNDYEKAITAVGGIIAKYDTDQKFPVWGFGAKYGGVIQHCFQVGPNAECERIQGVLDAYRGVFRTGLTMSGPTVFAEVIAVAAAQARSQQEEYKRIGKQAYKILLILTDGAVTDVNYTKQAVEAASDAPLSIVIVGIGQADFSSMVFLDNLRASNGRDVCQFVEFSRYQNDKSALTRETLAEIPDQLVDYFYGRGIMPMPPISGSQVSLTPSAADDEDIDLALDFGPDGEISLANNHGAVYDDTQYGANPSAPPAAGQAFNPYAAQQQAPYQPAGASSMYNPAAAPPLYQPQQQQQQAYQPYGSAPQAPSFHQMPPHQQQAQPPSRPHLNAQQPQQSMLNVVAPQGAYPGMPLQVQNPITGQMMRVAVPPGVQPGGRFLVKY